MHGAVGTRTDPALIPAYFNGVAQRLRGTFGVGVIETEVSAIGSVTQRALMSASQIRQALKSGVLNPSQPLHLIAHSLGGFDARYLVWHDMEGLRRDVRTVTCVGTPHLGCPAVTRMVGLLRHPWLSTPLFPFRMSIDLSFAIVQGLRLLEASEAARFNERCPDVSSVGYFNVAGSGRPQTVPTALLLSPTAALLALCGEPYNDGLVTVASASRGRPPLAVWEDDHAGLVGHDLDRPFGRPHPAHFNRYERLVGLLAQA